MNKNNQKGFSIVEVLLLLVVIGAVGFVGWYVWSQKLNQPAQTNSQNKDKVNVISHTDTSGSFTFEYPETWDIKPYKWEEPCCHGSTESE